LLQARDMTTSYVLCCHTSNTNDFNLLPDDEAATSLAYEYNNR